MKATHDYAKGREHRTHQLEQQQVAGCDVTRIDKIDGGTTMGRCFHIWMVHPPLLCFLFSPQQSLFVRMAHAWNPSLSRRSFVDKCASLTLTTIYFHDTSDDSIDRVDNFAYGSDWKGTSLELMSVSTAAAKERWDMARWPDPILRRPASPVDPRWYGTDTLRRVAELLQRTCVQAEAVGLAAQQCGVDARMVYLRNKPILINPSIVQRSTETEMRVWNEFCLVLPPTFRATVLRDAWVDVQYRDLGGLLHQTRLYEEEARAVQHEMDHDRGILILDHVGLDEMENDVMRSLEAEGHEQRMIKAYSRAVGSPLVA